MGRLLGVFGGRIKVYLYPVVGRGPMANTSRQQRDTRKKGKTTTTIVYPGSDDSDASLTICMNGVHGPAASFDHLRERRAWSGGEL